MKLQNFMALAWKTWQELSLDALSDGTVVGMRNWEKKRYLFHEDY